MGPPMARITRVLAVAVAAASLCLSHAATGNAGPLGFEYLSPLPGSLWILPETNIILRPGGVVDAASVARGLLHVNGSISGEHQGRLRLLSDHRSLTFQPDARFVPGEVVTCRLDAGLMTDSRGLVPSAEFAFTVAGPEREALRDFVVPVGGDEGIPPLSNTDPSAMSEPLPADFPHIRAAVYGTPAPGRLFLCNFVFAGTSVPSYLMILENDGTPFFYRKLPGVGLDFKMQPDGRLTYFDARARGFYALDAHYAVVDSFRCGNGYSTDGHDLQILPNGHALLMSYDPQIVDLSQVVKGGFQDATVIGLIIQELDEEKNVVFQWRSWDHFQITDVVSHSLANAVVDYVHGNSIDADPDGDLILSSRHMNEVTKISRTTGDILWRLGGRNNQFTFLNDPIAFSHQHAVRLLPNGHLVLFDNGNFRLPLFSRAMEYAIDETQKTATLVWQYRLSPDVFGGAFGYVQRFSNGNTLIGWGATTPTLTEVAPDGSIVSELTFDSAIASYRVFRFEWPPVKAATVEINPSVFSVGSRVGSITAMIRPVAADFSLADVELSTVRLNGTVPADTTGTNLVDVSGGGPPSLIVRFDAEPFLALLSLGSNQVEVTGSLATGESFRGLAEVTLFSPRAQPQGVASLRLVSAPGAIPVELTTGGDRAHAQSFAVYDVQGRLVKRLSLAQGARSRLSWDGLASDGRRVPSGIYFIRAETNTSGRPLKVVINR